MSELKGGTTGQILSKTSATDMDFTWTTPNPGDITAVTAGTGITGGGTSGDVTVSFDQANFGGGQFAAGKNKIINGNFGIWQRGTSGFSLGAAFNADRWAFYRDGSGATDAVTQQTFTPGTAPVAGYEGQFFWRYAATVAGTGATERSLYTKMEDVRTFAGQTVTLSFWAKADAARTLSLLLIQNFGSGGSAQVTTTLTSQAITTSWARYSVTASIPSISGKTVGTSSNLQLTIGLPVNVVQTIDIWGVQLEAGSVATPFQTASGGSPQAELAMCQRYYWRTANSSLYAHIGFVRVASSTAGDAYIQFPVAMRTAPTSIDFSTLGVTVAGSIFAITALTQASQSNLFSTLSVTNASSGYPAGSLAVIANNNSTSAFLGFSAEL